jgi:outer membrane protein TolC
MRNETRVPLAAERIALGLVALVLATSAAAGPPRRLTMEQALAMAEEAPHAVAAALELQRVRAQTRGAGLWPNPELSYDREASGTEVEGLAAVSFALPLSGRLALERSAAGSALDAAQRLARQQRVERGARVREAFLDVIAAQERDRLLAMALGDIEGLVEKLRAREAEGESSGYDRMRAEQAQAELAIRRLESGARLVRVRAVLGALLGQPRETLIAAGTLDPPVLPLPSVSEATSRASVRGDVEAQSAEAKRRELLARAATRGSIPEPVVWVGRKTACLASVCDSGLSLGISVSLPVFDRGQHLRSARRAEEEAARTHGLILAQQASAEARAALAEVRALRESEAALARAPSAARLLLIAGAAYEEGEMRIFELLDAHQTALETRLRATDLRLAARRAEVALDLTMGGEP